MTLYYFGKEHTVTPDEALEWFKSALPDSFMLQKRCADVFGEDKDTPVIVYEFCLKSRDDEVQIACQRTAEHFKDKNIAERKYNVWVPHISHLKYEDAPPLLLFRSVSLAGSPDYKKD